MKKRIVVFGASGLVGAALAEYLVHRGMEVVPVIRQAGNAWRLLRLGLDIKQVDIMSQQEISAAMAGCTHVVNCTRGDDQVMMKGLANLLEVSRAHGIARFVHLSSVMIYGDLAIAHKESEDLPKLKPTTYGGIKQRQDCLVQKAARKGLQATIIIPPNISGIYSYYLLSLMDAISNGEFTLIDNGSNPCELVDVMNLCHGIMLALDNGPGTGESYFITDGESTAWANVVEDLLRVRPIKISVPVLSRHAAEAILQQEGKKRHSPLKSLVHLFSSDMREALRKDPLLKQVDISVRHLVAKLGPKMENRLRLAIEGPLRVPKRSTSYPIANKALIAHQFRDSRYSIDKARQGLGYTPIISYKESMKAFSNWYRSTHGLDTEYAPLLSQQY